MKIPPLCYNFLIKNFPVNKRENFIFSTTFSTTKILKIPSRHQDQRSKN